MEPSFAVVFEFEEKISIMTSLGYMPDIARGIE